MGRHKHQAITDDDLKKVGTVTGQELWSAISNSEISTVTRGEVINAILNNRSSVDVTFRDVYCNLEKYKDKRVRFYGKTGILTDAFVGASDTYMLVLDGLIYGGPDSTPVKVYLDEGEDVVVATETKMSAPHEESSEEWARRNRDGFTYMGYVRAGSSEIYQTVKASWVLENIAQLRGRTVMVRIAPTYHALNSRDITGILEDARQTSSSIVNFLVGAQLYADGLDYDVRLYEPEYCRSTKNEIYKETKHCQLLRHHLGNHKF